jgi:signal transduction histidine kinase/ligand-binding sensor domain-containing protein
MLPPGALALSPDLLISQLYHTAWSAGDGAPTGVEFLAQTNDGYLWIAGAGGLFRFDGVRFERIESLGGRQLPSSNIVTLFAPRTGGLWVGYRFGGASFIDRGTIANYSERDGLPGGTVARFVQDRSGAVWASTTSGLMRFNGSAWKNAHEQLRLPSQYVRTLHVARDGTLWLALGQEIMSLRPGQRSFVSAGIQTSDREVDFVEAPDGTMWLTDERLGVRAVYVPAETTGSGHAQHEWIALRDPAHGSLWGKLIDRDGTLWAASSVGIHRVKNLARLLVRENTAHATRDAFSNVDGLTASYASAFLEDREGNIWIGTTGGIDRFRESRLTRVDLARAANGFAIAEGDDGALFVGIDSEDGAFAVRPPSSVIALPGPQFITCVYRADDGSVWFGGRTKLWHSGGSANGEISTPITIPVDRANANYPVQAIAQDRSGRLWVSVVRTGLFRYSNGNWTRVGEQPLTMATGPDGRVWLAYPRSRIQVVDPTTDVVVDLSRDAGPALGNIMSVLARDQDTWIGGELGLARFDGHSFHAVNGTAGKQLPSISGIDTSPEGDLWLSSSAGALKIPVEEVQRFSADAHHEVHYDLYDFLDGMPGTPNSIRPLPSIAAGSDGRLWFSTSNGIVWIDPKHVRRNTIAPNVELQSIVVDGRYYEPAAGLRLQTKPRSVQISYTALSLSIPERVHFRYQLSAGEPWEDAGPRRTAYFTDLGPGNYRFRVTASNNDGVWNDVGASVDFTIPPTFYQTRWFYALSIFACVAVLGAAYRLRVRGVAAQVRGRLEARLAERERIARDLHDTLLQGMQGLILRFQVVAKNIPSGERARELMEQSLERADKLIEESRDKVKELRPAAHDVADLARTLAVEGKQLAELHASKFRMSIRGTSRDIHPVVREEALLIAREAMANAFRHAEAVVIEAEVAYGETALHILVRDDGRGISESVLHVGSKPDHFGMTGMRERADKLGAALEVRSKARVGTEIELRVPAKIAYRRARSLREA